MATAPGSAAFQGQLWGTQGRDRAEQEVLSTPLYERLIGALGIGTGKRVLDVGCGSGVFLRLAADRGAGVFDAAKALIAIARERVPDADLRVGDPADAALRR